MIRDTGGDTMNRNDMLKKVQKFLEGYGMYFDRTEFYVEMSNLEPWRLDDKIEQMIKDLDDFVQFGDDCIYEDEIRMAVEVIPELCNILNTLGRPDTETILVATKIRCGDIVHVTFRDGQHTIMFLNKRVVEDGSGLLHIGCQPGITGYLKDAQAIDLVRRK